MTTDNSNLNQNEIKSGINIDKNPISPVVEEKSFFKKWAGAIFAVLAALFCYYIFVYGHSKNNDDTKNNQANMLSNSSNNELSAPQLPISQTQVAHLKEALANMNTEQPLTLDNQQQEAMKLLQLRMSAPIEVYSADNEQIPNSTNSDNQGNNANNNSSNAVLGGDGTGDANTKFMAKVSNSEASTQEATHIAHLNTTLTQGTMIQATLEPPISSDLPGMLRAVTSYDIYSEDDSNLLVPRGSKLIGQYTNSISQGQSRVFVVWQRLIRPDGIDIELNSPGTDPLGGAGLPADDIDHHFWQQFGTASLLSIIGAGTANMGVNPADQFNSSSAYRQALASSFNQTAQQSFQNTGVIQPTLSINQGTKINVFVARDLDFYNELTKNNGQSYDS